MGTKQFLYYDPDDMYALADKIREKAGTSDSMTISEMADAVESISGGYPEPTGTVSITQNGTVNVKDYASANVNVPNSYTSSDEGKVVSSGALVAQGSDTITENGTYDTTLISELIANISGGGGGDLSQYDVIKGATWEQGAVSGTSGKTWEQNKTSNTTRIRMVETIAVEPSHTLYFKINDGYDASIHQYNSSGKFSSISGWGDYDNKGIVINQPNLGITIRKNGDTAITPSEISDVGLAVYDITAFIEAVHGES